VKPFFKYYVVLIGLIMFISGSVHSQGFRNLTRGGGITRGSSGGGNDSLERRNRFEDSITIRFRYLDSSRNYFLDSSVGDFSRRFPIPYTHHNLGNVGTAARSIVFNPDRTAGFDPGFHAYDVYKWRLDRVRFFNTTRPYTELGYVIGSQTQQVIDIIHTQNLRPYWNMALQYRLINSPGFFNNQRANHNNYLLTSWYQSPNRRYNNYLVFLANNLQSSENGGILTDRDYLKDPIYENRFSVPTKIGSAAFTRDPFSSPLTTGNSYKEFNALLRQQYDFGRKDSIITDSTVIPLFYPRVRFEHTFKSGNYRYKFIDLEADSIFYKRYYDTTLTKAKDTLQFAESWREWSNDFSIYTFPDANNLQQFLKLGAELQLLTGEIRGGKRTFSNIIAHGTYQNRTRNQKWDMRAFGRLYAAGLNAGDYHAYVSLQRLISQQIGSLQIGFENINRSPSFIADERSNFNLDRTRSLNKENVSHIFAKAINPALKLEIGADYYLMSNYIYYSNFYRLAQEGALFNVLRINAAKTFRLSRYLNLYSEAWIQQKTGAVALNIPLFFTRNRIAFEGNFFRNLNLSTGLEVRYHTPYKMDHYSPVLGQFTFQDTTTINNRPDINAFFNFRIRSFKAYVRAENLNALEPADGFSFTRHNFGAPDYPYPGLVLRFGIYWSFVN
jgi:hypothetical protein